MLLKGLKAAPTFPFLPMRECRFLVEVGRARDAVRYCQTALALRPVAPPLGYSLGHAFNIAGQPDRAREAVERAARYSPDHTQTRRLRFELLAFGPDPAAARSILHDTDRRPQNFTSAGVEALEAMIEALQTRAPGDVERALGLLRTAARAEQLDARYLVLGAASLGRVDDAFSALDHPALRFDADQGYLFEPASASLQRDPRFWRVTRRLGLIDYWRKRGAWPDFCSDANHPVDCPAAAERWGR